MRIELTSPLLSGPAIARIQELLHDAGYNPGDIDGIYGPKTAMAVELLQAANGQASTGIVDDYTMLLFGSGASYHEYTAPANIIDLRDDHPKPKLYSASRSPRKWQDIDTLVVHQTGIRLSENHKRWFTLNAHFAVLGNAEVLWLNDLEDWVWHAQSLSGGIGIEFNGNFEGVVGNRSTYWAPGGGPDRLLPGHLDGAAALIKFLIMQFAKHGQRIKYIRAHRQSYLGRRGDPGQEIWSGVAIPWMVLTGATDGGPSWKKGGRPIPREWNPKYKGQY